MGRDRDSTPYSRDKSSKPPPGMRVSSTPKPAAKPGPYGPALASAEQEKDVWTKWANEIGASTWECNSPSLLGFPDFQSLLASHLTQAKHEASQVILNAMKAYCLEQKTQSITTIATLKASAAPAAAPLAPVAAPPPFTFEDAQRYFASLPAEMATKLLPKAAAQPKPDLPVLNGPEDGDEA
jgi:hypothetical protein